MARREAARPDGFQAIYNRYVGDDPERIASFQQELANAEVARDIYRLRTEAGLSQRDLAALVGTTASVICRLEDADYEGHSLSLLRRVAVALGRRVEVRFPPARKTAPQKAKGGVSARGQGAKSTAQGTTGHAGGSVESRTGPGKESRRAKASAVKRELAKV